MASLNQRQVPPPPDGEKPSRRVSILVDFPDSRFEAIVLQWDRARPSVLFQLKHDPAEPIQFPGQRPSVPGNQDLPRDRPSALDRPLHDFVDPTSGLIFGRDAIESDILFSMRAFSLLQPEPDLVLPPEAMWECRTEALSGIGVADAEGTAPAGDDRQPPLDL